MQYVRSTPSTQEDGPRALPSPTVIEKSNALDVRIVVASGRSGAGATSAPALPRTTMGERMTGIVNGPADSERPQLSANALSALRAPMASAIHANPAVSAWATIANNRAS